MGRWGVAHRHEGVRLCLECLVDFQDFGLSVVRATPAVPAAVFQEPDPAASSRRERAGASLVRRAAANSDMSIWVRASDSTSSSPRYSAISSNRAQCSRRTPNSVESSAAADLSGDAPVMPSTASSTTSSISSSSSKPRCD